MVETERSARGGVFDRLRGEGFLMAMQKAVGMNKSFSKSGIIFG